MLGRAAGVRLFTSAVSCPKKLRYSLRGMKVAASRQGDGLVEWLLLLPDRASRSLRSVQRWWSSHVRLVEPGSCVV